MPLKIVNGLCIARKYIKIYLSLVVLSTYIGSCAMYSADDSDREPKPRNTYNLATNEEQHRFIDHIHLGITAIDDETIVVGKHVPLTTPLIFSLAHEDEDLALFVLDERPAINKKDSTGLAPIHALTYNPNPQLAKLLLDSILKQGVVLEVTDAEGKNLFHYICRFGRKELYDRVIKIPSAVSLLAQKDSSRKAPEDYLAYCGDEFSKMYLEQRIKHLRK